MRSITEEKAFSSARSGVMSLNTIPGCGKSGTSRIRALSSSTVLFTAKLPLPRRRPSATAPFGLPLRLALLLLLGRSGRPGTLARAGGPGGPALARSDHAGRLQLALHDPQARPRRPGLGLGPDLLIPGLPLLHQGEDRRGH